MKRFVIYSERDGVYLGSCLGLGFWSKLDPVGQDGAVTFESAEVAKAVMTAWVCIEDLVETRIVEVEADMYQSNYDMHYASVASCVAAGLPAWDPKAVS